VGHLHPVKHTSSAACSVAAAVCRQLQLFHLSTPKWGHGLPVSWASFLQFLSRCGRVARA